METAQPARAAVASVAPAAPVTVRIPGEPVAWQRPRHFQHGKHVHFFEAEKPRSWKGMAQEHMQRAMLAAGHYAPLEGPLEVVIVAVWRLPKTKERKVPVPRRFRAQRPDVDQIEKLLLDAGNEVLWRDDAQVVRVVAEKWTGAQGEAPSVLVEVRSLQPHGAAAERVHTPSPAATAGALAAGQLRMDGV